MVFLLGLLCRPNATTVQMLAMRSRTPLDMKMIEDTRSAIDLGTTFAQQFLSFARQQPLTAEIHDLAALIRDFEPMLVRAGTRASPSEVR